MSRAGTASCAVITKHIDMATQQLARGLWTGFAPTQDPFQVPNGMAENLRTLDDVMGLYTMRVPQTVGTALPSNPGDGDGQIFTDGSFAVFNAGSWKQYDARPGVKALMADGSDIYLSVAEGGWLSMRQHAALDTGLISQGIYLTTAQGIAAVADGQFFSTPSPNSDESLILWQRNGSTAIEVKRYPTFQALDAARQEAKAWASKEGAPVEGSNYSAKHYAGQTALDAASTASDAAQTEIDRQIATQAAADAIAAASASGDFIFAKDLADMLSKLPQPDDQVIEVAVDADHENARTRYVVDGGVPVFVVNLDQVRTDLGDPVKGPSVAIGAFAGLENYTTFSSIGAMALAKLPVGILAKVGSTVFEISGVAPLSAQYPMLPTKFGYAIPVEKHTSRHFGVRVGKGQVVGSDWQSSANRSTQGIEFDNRAGTLFVSSLNNAAVPQTGKLIEYSYNSSGIGAEVMRTGEMPIGHSEYFAIVYDTDGQRYVWAGDDATKTIRKVKLIAGATAADTVQSISVDSIAASVTVNVFGYDHKHIAVWLVDVNGKDAVHVCRISDLDVGVFAPVKVLDTPSVGRIWSLFPGQMLRSIGGIFAGLSGARADLPTTANAGWYDESIDDVVAKIPVDWATAGSEVEGLAFYWNAASAKFETHASIWYGSTGRIEFYSLTGAANAVLQRQYAHAFLKERYTSGGPNFIPAQSGTSGMRYSSQAPIAVPGLHIGGDRRNTGPFDPNDFFISQWNHASEGRESAVIRFKGMEIRLDGPNDLVLGSSFRLLTADTSGTQKEGLQLLPHGVKVGNSRLLSSTAPKWIGEFVANSPVDGGILSSIPGGAGPGFVTNSVSHSFATTFSDLYLGNYNLSTKTSTLWLYVNGARVRAATDGATDLGTLGQRFKDLFLVNAPIVTCDGDEKTEPIEIPDAWLDAYGEVREWAWKWLDSIVRKGDRARTHTGLIAQHLRDAFVRHGVMAEDSTDCPWGGLCYSRWDDEYRTIPAVMLEHPAEFSQLVVDAEGNPILIKEAWVEEVEPESKELVQAAGSRWGIRSDQCRVLFEAWQRRENRRMQDRLKRLEDHAGLSLLPQ